MFKVRVHHSELPDRSVYLCHHRWSSGERHHQQKRQQTGVRETTGWSQNLHEAP